MSPEVGALLEVGRILGNIHDGMFWIQVQIALITLVLIFKN